MADNEKTEGLSLAELVTENYAPKVADRILTEFSELPDALTETSGTDDNSGAFYDYVKECISDGKKVPSGIDFCKRFIKDGKYTFETVSEESYDKFIRSEELIGMCDI